MPLQNRVTPFGDIIQTPERGAWTGNRGVIHKNKAIIRPFRTTAWITCLLEYKNMRREVMTENRWTELFFLDEATAFAAGHRPCAFCRHIDFKRFKSLWLTANKNRYSLNDEKMTSIDAILQAERIDAAGKKKTYFERLENLPSGVMIVHENKKPVLYWEGRLLEWSPGGYINTRFIENNVMVKVLTPESVVRVFRLGYIPQIHRTANA